MKKLVIYIHGKGGEADEAERRNGDLYDFRRNKKRAF